MGSVVAGLGVVRATGQIIGLIVPQIIGLIVPATKSFGSQNTPGKRFGLSENKGVFMLC